MNMDNDLEILRKIFSDMKFTMTFSDMLISLIQSKFDESGIPEITPHFIYIVLMPELGKNQAMNISSYFEQMKKEGGYETELQRMLKNSPYLK